MLREGGEEGSRGEGGRPWEERGRATGLEAVTPVTWRLCGCGREEAEPEARPQPLPLAQAVPPSRTLSSHPDCPKMALSPSPCSDLQVFLGSSSHPSCSRFSAARQPGRSRKLSPEVGSSLQALPPLRPGLGSGSEPPNHQVICHPTPPDRLYPLIGLSGGTVAKVPVSFSPLILEMGLLS